MSATRRLPDRPHLAKLRDEARALRDAGRAGDQAALARLTLDRTHGGPAVVVLANAQRVVARDYGFASWAQLKARVDELAGPEPSTIERLRRAFDAGDHSRELVMRLARALVQADRWRESARLLETVADDSRDWTLFGTILARYNRVEDYDSCLRCQRKRLEYGADLPPRMRVLLWQPSGTALTVARAGAGDWALERILELQAQAGDLCSAYSKCQLDRCELHVHLVAERWDDVLRVAWRHTDWVRGLPAADPQLVMPPESVEPEEPILCGERLRFWSITFMVGTGVAPALRRTGGDGGRAAAELRSAVASLEQVCRSSEAVAQPDEARRQEHGWNRFQLRRTLGYAAEGMVHLRRYDDGLRLFERIEELGDELNLEESVWKAAAGAGAGDVARAVAQLRDLVVPRGRRRQVLGAFHRAEDLAPLAEHAQVAPILACWRDDD